MSDQQIRELDVVALTVDLPQVNLVRGQVGTVVFVYPPDSFEVEFVDDDGRTYGLTTLTASQLLRLHYKPIPA
ncbi:MAG: DUF4926 domain-containing protein [Tepidisphaeraceae bacterium]|jgi:hypothetical protein